ncbi:MAG TPA: peptide chain release factor N(5)-glutamine methyltransferase [Fimbriimonadaceae bacterium]|nr:peptide chain release factor N(5)-glutamine methyltransferase [Fimbriimonadaceae bacterium]
MTVGEWVLYARRRLAEAGVESPALEAQMLAAHVLLVDRSRLIANPELELSELAGEPLLQRRLSGEPLAYILGWREFYGRRFEVGPGVLVPRHETEILVEAALEFLPADSAAAVLDLGAGSGILAITIKRERPRAVVTGSDISSQALDVARRNALALDADVRFVEGDLFAPVAAEKFDLIVCNPPYIANHELLPVEIGDFEPSGALFAGDSGLEFYERLAVEAGLHVPEDGRLMVEVGHLQGRAVSGIFESNGWSVERVVKDLSGIDRVVVAQPLVV